VKPLDRKQLKNWDDYLNFEIREGNHDRIVLLFERCITACAHYESYWCKYARYLENYHKKNTKEISVHLQKSQINVEIVSKEETEEEEALIAAAMSALEKIISEIEHLEENSESEESQVATTVELLITTVEAGLSLCDKVASEVDQVNVVSSTVDDRANEVEIRVPPINLDGDPSNRDGSPSKSGEPQTNEISSPCFTSLLSVPSFPPVRFHWQEVVRDIYKRGSIVHCPRKPTLRLQWAAYEEELGKIVKSHL
jgi:hypothetical protein